MSSAARSASTRITAGSASARSATRQVSTSPVSSASSAAARAVPTALPTAARSTVVPHWAASAIRTANSGCQQSRQLSRKVPVEATWERTGTPQSTPSSRRRCSSRERAASVSLRRSRSRSRGSGAGLSRRVRWSRARSRWSGTAGASSGTEPSASPITNRSRTSARATSEPSHITARTASSVSVSPASGRPRSPARARASRTASMTCAEETGWSSARSRPAARVSQPGSGSPSVRCRWWYQPGETIPAP